MRGLAHEVDCFPHGWGGGGGDRTGFDRVEVRFEGEEGLPVARGECVRFFQEEEL